MIPLNDQIEVIKGQIACLEFFIELLRSNDIRARGYIKDLLSYRNTLIELNKKYDSMMNDETIEFIYSEVA